MTSQVQFLKQPEGHLLLDQSLPRHEEDSDFDSLFDSDDEECPWLSVDEAGSKSFDVEYTLSVNAPATRSKPEIQAKQVGTPADCDDEGSIFDEEEGHVSENEQIQSDVDEYQDYIYAEQEPDITESDSEQDHLPAHKCALLKLTSICCKSSMSLRSIPVSNQGSPVISPMIDSFQWFNMSCSSLKLDATERTKSQDEAPDTELVDQQSQEFFGRFLTILSCRNNNEIQQPEASDM